MRPPFPSFPLLRGPTVTLRRILSSEASDVREFTVYDGVPAATDEAAAAVLRRIDEDMERGEAVHWGICPAGSDRVVGTCGYYRGFEGQVGELGYVLSEHHRGRGLMTASVRSAVDFGFEVMELVRVVAYTSANNTPSIAVLRRCGFTETDGEDGILAFSLAREEQRASTVSVG